MYQLEEEIIKDMLLHCKNNNVDSITQNGLIVLIKDNFQRHKLSNKNRL